MKQVLAILFVSAFAVGNVWADRGAAELYPTTCGACHASGLGGLAPRTGAADEWAPRLAKGTATLVASVKSGLNAMPAGGMCGDCTDTEYQALIDFMSGSAK